MEQEWLVQPGESGALLSWIGRSAVKVKTNPVSKEGHIE
jgi:hypothetical protein